MLRNRVIRKLASRCVLCAIASACTGCSRPQASAPPSPAIAAGFNVVLISIDTLRADHLGCYGHPTAHTPNIDRLAANGVRFEQCISAVPITLPSHSTILTGQYPFTHGARDNGTFVLAAENETLAERLRAAGYATGAAVAAYVLNREFGVDQGFETFLDVRNTPEGERRAELSADEVAGGAIDWLQGVHDQRFFLFVHFFDPHQPYTPPPAYRRMFPEDGYLAEIAFTDSQVGRVLSALDSLGVAQRTLIVLTSDHGEGLGDHGESTHACFVYDTTLHVPLIIAAPPDLPGGVVVGEQVRTVDISATILALTGKDPFEGPGYPLLDPATGGPRVAARAAYAESFYPRFGFGFSQLRAWREDGWKLIHAPSPELYQIAVAQDPRETTNLAGAEPQRVELMRSRLRELIAAARPIASGTNAGGANVADLRALGYVGAGGALDESAEIDRFDPVGPSPAEFVELIETTIRASNLLTMNRPAEAESLLRPTLATLSAEGLKLPWIHDLLGGALAKQGKFAEAAEEFRTAIAADPGNADARTRLGVAELQLGYVDAALEQLEIAANFEPVSSLTLQYLAVALARNGEEERAVDVYASAQRIDESLAAPARRLAETYDLAPPESQRGGTARRLAEFALLAIDIGEFDAAERLLSPKVPADSDPPLVLLGRAELALAQGDKHGAVDALREASGSIPGNPRVWRRLAGLLTETGDEPGARAVLETGLQRNPRAAELLADYARLLARSPGEAARAVGVARQAIDDSPDPSPELVEALAVALDATGDREAAIAVLDDLLRSPRVAVDPLSAQGARELRDRLRNDESP